MVGPFLSNLEGKCCIEKHDGAPIACIPNVISSVSPIPQQSYKMNA